MSIHLKNSIAILVWGSLFFFSCNEEKETKTDGPTLPEKLIQPQVYYNLMNELDFNRTILKQLQVKSYSATYYLLDSSKAKIKECFTAVEPILDKPRFYMIQAGRNRLDTTVLEMVNEVNNDSLICSRRVYTTDGRINHFLISEQYDTNHLLLQRKRRNLQTGKTEIEKLSYTHNHLTMKELVGLGKEEYTYDEMGNMTSYLLRNQQLDTIRYSLQRNHGSTVEVNYVKGGLDQFIYTYNDHQLNTIQWFQKGKLLVTITFSYDANGLLKTRMVQSSVKPIPSSRTDYQYTF